MKIATDLVTTYDNDTSRDSVAGSGAGDASYYPVADEVMSTWALAVGPDPRAKNRSYETGSDRLEGSRYFHVIVQGERGGGAALSVSLHQLWMGVDTFLVPTLLLNLDKHECIGGSDPNWYFCSIQIRVCVAHTGCTYRVLLNQVCVRRWLLQATIKVWAIRLAQIRQTW